MDIPLRSYTRLNTQQGDIQRARKILLDKCKPISILILLDNEKLLLKKINLKNQKYEENKDRLLRNKVLGLFQD